MADTATGEMPSGAIRRAYQQQCLTDGDRHDRTFVQWAHEPPPNTDDREGEAESGPPSEIEKELVRVVFLMPLHLMVRT
jgi:hypothetical protein